MTEVLFEGRKEWERVELMECDRGQQWERLKLWEVWPEILGCEFLSDSDREFTSILRQTALGRRRQHAEL